MAQDTFKGKGRSSQRVAGVLLLLLGLFLLALQLLPRWLDRVDIGNTWPLIIVTIGLFVLIVGMINRSPASVVPACILAGIGGLLFWQNLTGDWGSWTYAWTLISGFAGIGQVLRGLLSGQREHFAQGLSMIAISAALFLIFGSFFGAFGFLGPYWPMLLIALGAGLFVRGWVAQD